MSALERIDTSKLYPQFIERLNTALDAIEKRGVSYVALHGYRSWAEQFKMRLKYLKGEGGKAAPAGLSSHQYGLAVDFCRDVDVDKKGLQPGWLASHYDILGLEMQKVGLHWGAAYNDRPHVSWPGYVDAEDLHPLQRLWRDLRDLPEDERLRECWKYVNKKGA